MPLAGITLAAIEQKLTLYKYTGLISHNVMAKGNMALEKDSVGL